MPFEERIKRARTTSEDHAEYVASELKSIKLTTSNLATSVEELDSVNLTERDPIRRLIQALELLKQKIHSHHSEINEAIRVLQFVKSKMDEDLPKEGFRAFRTIVSREYLPKSGDLKLKVNSACADLIKVLDAEFQIEHTISGDLELLHAQLSQFAGQVSEL